MTLNRHCEDPGGNPGRRKPPLIASPDFRRGRNDEVDQSKVIPLQARSGESSRSRATLDPKGGIRLERGDRFDWLGRAPAELAHLDVIRHDIE